MYAQSSLHNRVNQARPETSLLDLQWEKIKAQPLDPQGNLSWWQVLTVIADKVYKGIGAEISRATKEDPAAARGSINCFSFI